MKKNKNITYETLSDCLSVAFYSLPQKYTLDLANYPVIQGLAYNEEKGFHFPLLITESGKPARQYLHVFIERTNEGKYKTYSYIL